MHPFYSQFLPWGLFCFAFCLAGCNTEPQYSTKPPTKTTWTQSELDAINVYVIAGDYYEMQIGIKGDELTGVYRDPTAPKDKNCLFFFEGRIGTQNPIQVICYDPTNTKAPIRGSFKFLGDAIIAQLDQLPQEVCTVEFTDKIGHSVVLDTKKEWSAIRMIQHATTFYSKPSLESSASEYQLLQGTVVAVQEKRNNWILVEMMEGDHRLGWIPEHVLYPLVEM